MQKKLTPKLLNQKFYAKQFVRFVDEKGLIAIDNNGLILKTEIKTDTKIGCPVQYKLLKIKHYAYQRLCHKIVIPRNVTTTESSINHLLKSLEKKDNDNVLIGKRMRGGFVVYSQGILGFMPNNHVIISIQRLLWEVEKSNKIYLPINANLQYRHRNLDFIKKIKISTFKTSIVPHQGVLGTLQRIKHVTLKSKLMINYVFLNETKSTTTFYKKNLYEYVTNKEKIKSVKD